MKTLIAENKYKCKLSVIPKIQKFVEQIVSKYTNDVKIIEAINFAVAEASSNSIKHGNKFDLSKNVELKIFLENNSIIISFFDFGRGFIPENLPDPTLPENLLRDNGRGIFIIKSVIDSLSYNFSSNGTETILKINLK
jgi:serine/threonine-protein kinase RsbW